MKTPEQIYDDYGFSAELPLGLGYLKINIIEAILAYHAQFQVTQSERERMIIIAVLGWMDEGDIRDVYNNRTNSVYNMFIQSDAYKAIPPAKQLPTSVEAQEWADNACYDKRTDEGVWIGEYTLNAMMEMYYWITSNEN